MSADQREFERWMATGNYPEVTEIALEQIATAKREMGTSIEAQEPSLLFAGRLRLIASTAIALSALQEGEQRSPNMTAGDEG